MNLIHQPIGVQCLAKSHRWAEKLNLSVLRAVCHPAVLEIDFWVEVLGQLEAAHPEVINHIERFIVGLARLISIDIGIGGQTEWTINRLRVAAGQDLRLKNYFPIVYLDAFDIWTDPLLVGRKNVVEVSFTLLVILFYLDLICKKFSAKNTRHGRKAFFVLLDIVVDWHLKELNADVLTYYGRVQLTPILVCFATSQLNRHGLTFGRYVVYDVISEVWLKRARGVTH